MRHSARPEMVKMVSHLRRAARSAVCTPGSRKSSDFRIQILDRTRALC